MIEKELIKTFVEQGYERLNINSEDELILNLRRQLEKINNYHFTDDLDDRPYHSGHEPAYAD